MSASWVFCLSWPLPGIKKILAYRKVPSSPITHSRKTSPTLIKLPHFTNGHLPSCHSSNELLFSHFHPKRYFPSTIFFFHGFRTPFHSSTSHTLTPHFPYLLTPIHSSISPFLVLGTEGTASKTYRNQVASLS